MSTTAPDVGDLPPAVLSVHELPREIESAANALCVVQVEITIFRGHLQAIEDRITREVLAALNEAQKPLYTNDTAREIAKRERLADDDRYNELKSRLRDLEAERWRCEARMERLRREFSIARLDYEIEYLGRRDHL